MEVWKLAEHLKSLYEVSNLGNARAVEKIDGNGLTRKVRPLKQSTTKDGYKKIHVFLNGKPKHILAHRVIYETFFGPIPEGLTVNHKNGIRDDNRPENLEVLTHHENILHSKNVLKTNYATYGNQRMSDEVRAQIKELALQKMTYRSIGAVFGFSKTQVSNVVNGRSNGKPQEPGKFPS